MKTRQLPDSYSTTFERGGLFQHQTPPLPTVNRSMIQTSFKRVIKNVTTNFYSKTALKRVDLQTRDKSEFDINIPLKPQKTFKIRAKVKSVKKYSPKPFFD